MGKLDPIMPKLGQQGGGGHPGKELHVSTGRRQSLDESLLQREGQVSHKGKSRSWMKGGLGGRSKLGDFLASHLSVCSIGNHLASSLHAPGFSLNPSVLTKEALG